MTQRANISPNQSEAPLAGRFVLVTRAAHQSRSIAEPLEALGATVVSMPVIQIIDPPDPEAVARAARDVAGYDWLVLTSANAVDRFWAALETAGTAHLLADGDVRIAVVGMATGRALTRHGVRPDLVPHEYRAEGVLEAMRERVAVEPGQRCRVLYVRALEGRDVLIDGLRELGCSLDLIAAYATVPATPEPVSLGLLTDGRIDVATFLSPSAVRGFSAFLEAAGLDAREVMGGLTIASIGPVTTEAVGAAGGVVAIEPSTSTVPELVAAVVREMGV